MYEKRATTGYMAFRVIDKDMRTVENILRARRIRWFVAETVHPKVTICCLFCALLGIIE